MNKKMKKMNKNSEKFTGKLSDSTNNCPPLPKNPVAGKPFKFCSTYDSDNVSDNCLEEEM